MDKKEIFGRIDGYFTEFESNLFYLESYIEHLQNLLKESIRTKDDRLKIKLSVDGNFFVDNANLDIRSIKSDIKSLKNLIKKLK